MRNVRMLGAGLAAAAALVGAVVGCTSEPPTAVGDSLTTTRVDTVLAPLRVGTVNRFGQQLVANPDRPLVDMELLYLGAEDGVASVVLVNYDFSAFSDTTPIGDNDQITPDMVTADNIVSVKLRLLVPCFYRDDTVCDTRERRVPDPGLRKYYEVYRLLEPFDENAAWPGAIPAFDPVRLNKADDYEDDRDNGFELSVELSLYPEDFAAWVQNGERVGFLIREGTGLEPVDAGIKGFSSRDNDLYKGSRIPCLPCEQVTDRFIGPTLRCLFNENVEVEPRQWNIDSAADVSTFHELADPPALADNLVLRTHLRSYPALSFDLSGLPANAFINRAILVVVNDTTSSFGYLQDLVVSEYDTLNFGGGIHAIELDQLDRAIDYTTTIAASVDPEFAERIDLVVTGTIQRYINQVEGMKPSFVLTAGESFLPPSASRSDYWLSQFNCFGVAAADTSLRPRLEITYSVAGELGEGGDD